MRSYPYCKLGAKDRERINACIVQPTDWIYSIVDVSTQSKVAI